MCDLFTLHWTHPDACGPHPSARFGQAMVSDGVKTLWVVGGTNGHMFFNDVWMFDVETMKWTEITAANAEDGDANAYFRDVVPDKNVPSGSVLLFYFIFFSFLFFSFLFFSFLFFFTRLFGNTPSVVLLIRPMVSDCPSVV